jgi:hypothetical protein
MVQLNGFNKTIVEVAWSMLHHKNISLEYFVEAINMTTYLRARCPHKAVEGMTSKEAWSRKQLTTNHLKIFG